MKRRSATAAWAGGSIRGPVRRAACVGVRDGSARVAACVRAAGADDGPAGVDRVSCRGVRVLRRVPARLVPDNLQTGVDKPDLYDPKINRSYAGLTEHYGTLVSLPQSKKLSTTSTPLSPTTLSPLSRAHILFALNPNFLVTKVQPTSTEQHSKGGLTRHPSSCQGYLCDQILLIIADIGGDNNGRSVSHSRRRHLR